MSMWLNNKFIIKRNLNKEKPCLKLGWCPYGQLVEEFPLKMENSKISCKVFGHDCPMFYHAEDTTEDKKEEGLRLKKKNKINSGETHGEKNK